MTEISLEEQRAWRAMDAGAYKESARLFEPLAERGSETALLCLGWMHSSGHLGRSDRDKAISYYERAARGGSALAKHYLGRAFMAKCDLRRARASFMDGAEQGNTACMSMAGRMLVRGQGGDADTQAGVAWLIRAADSGQVHARRELLRLEMQNSRSLWRRALTYWKVIQLALATFPRAARNRFSDDFR